MADAGYQLITSVIFVMVKRDFDYCEGFGSYNLGLVSNVVIENLRKIEGVLGVDFDVSLEADPEI
ncbi:hypothetical protein H6G97_35780 [Nostoc flagelliforme FACHB-838]|uniref:Transposase n=1 Tax=Nostoc flagelliforme FACHB-838 TaxID=2692904 RepID=A0ABR8DZG9_9NOSO|nr:hypothetical protein [Nostoc flagelliforme]MBD2534558.1 hypothetical protein [Nostoc flagelliforme FACHB-838]